MSKTQAAPATTREPSTRSAIRSLGYAAHGATSPLAPFQFDRRSLGPRDVGIEILYCGVCHSDLHTVRSEWSDWNRTIYPVVPGHEIVGRVDEVGEQVKGLEKKHGIVSEVEVIPIQQINQAYDRMLRSDVKYRFVIDMASIEQGTEAA